MSGSPKAAEITGAVSTVFHLPGGKGFKNLGEKLMSDICSFQLWD